MKGKSKVPVLGTDKSPQALELAATQFLRAHGLRWGGSSRRHKKSKSLRRVYRG